MQTLTTALTGGEGEGCSERIAQPVSAQNRMGGEGIQVRAGGLTDRCRDALLRQSHVIFYVIMRLFSPENER